MPSTNNTNFKTLYLYSRECYNEVMTKRDNSYADFDREKIFNSIISTMKENKSEYSEDVAVEIFCSVITDLNNMKEKVPTYIPSAEDIHEFVKSQFVKAKLDETYKNYIKGRYKKIILKKKRTRRKIPYKRDFSDARRFKTYDEWLERKIKRYLYINHIKCD